MGKPPINMFENTSTPELIVWVTVFILVLLYNTFCSTIDMSIFYIIKYFNIIANSYIVLTVVKVFGAVRYSLNLPSKFGERLWLRWHSPQLAGHMDVLKGLEGVEKRPLLDASTLPRYRDDIV